ncbi:hypothetical protein Q3G72_011786 [Acer saccharum]|nr:hypothetical protein Q3G72_011786 [Acer saccharum]
MSTSSEAIPRLLVNGPALAHSGREDHSGESKVRSSVSVVRSSSWERISRGDDPAPRSKEEKRKSPIGRDPIGYRQEGSGRETVRGMLAGRLSFTLPQRGRSIRPVPLSFQASFPMNKLPKELLDKARSLTSSCNARARPQRSFNTH